MKTWKQKIGKRRMAHVLQTTKHGTLREVKANAARMPGGCYECNAILKLTKPRKRRVSKRSARA